MPSLSRLILLGLVFTALSGCSGNASGPGPAAVGRVPLPDLGSRTYKGFVGGLYPAGSNVQPASHTAAGQSRAQAIVPLDTSGTPSAGGKIVLLSLGMSNTTQEFCSGSSTTTSCNSWSFMGQAAADARVNHTTLAIVNGARGGQDAQTWDTATDVNYDSVRINRLGPLGLTERQGEGARGKQAGAGPPRLLPPTPSAPYPLPSPLSQ